MVVVGGIDPGHRYPVAALVLDQGLGIDALAERVAGDRHLLPEVRLAESASGNLEAKPGIRGLFLELDQGARHGCLGARDRSDGARDQGEGVRRRQYFDAVVAADACRLDPGGTDVRGSGMLSWLQWTLVRAPILPVAWVLAHATVLLWKALDRRYIDQAQWIVDVILKPLHPLGVWLVASIMPPLRTLVSNMPPTHLDADKVLYGFLVPIYMAVILGVLRLGRWAVTGRS